MLSAAGQSHPDGRICSIKQTQLKVHFKLDLVGVSPWMLSCNKHTPNIYIFVLSLLRLSSWNGSSERKAICGIFFFWLSLGCSPDIRQLVSLSPDAASDGQQLARDRPALLGAGSQGPLGEDPTRKSPQSIFSALFLLSSLLPSLTHTSIFSAAGNLPLPLLPVRELLAPGGGLVITQQCWVCVRACVCASEPPTQHLHNARPSTPLQIQDSAACVCAFCFFLFWFIFI